MKNCPYCGTKYPDAATTCLIDGESLVDDKPQLTITREVKLEIQPGQNLPQPSFTEYRWSARDAWKCVGMLFVFGNLLGLVILVMNRSFPSFYVWHFSGFGYFCVSLSYATTFVLTVIYFAHTESFTTFLIRFGSDRKPSDYVWFGVFMALLIRVFGHFMLTHGWGKGVSNYELSEFANTPGIERYFFLIPPLILAPIYEESIYRGFLYKAFRGSYSMIASMALIVGWTTYTHWPQYSQSLLAAFVLSMLTVVQCYLREKSDSLWDCILCHFVFNASNLFVSGLLR